MSKDLDDRLTALGIHLDAERSAITAATTVVSFGPRRRSTLRTVLAVAATAAVLIGLVAIATNTTGNPDVPTMTTPTTTPATIPTAVTTPAADTTLPATTAAPTTSPGVLNLGTLTEEFDLANKDDASRARAVAAMHAWIATLGLDATVTADDTLHVVVRNVPDPYVNEIGQLVGDLQFQVQLRPVLTACSEKSALRVFYDASSYGRTLLLPVLTGELPPARRPTSELLLTSGCGVGPSLSDGTVFAGDATASPVDGGGTSISASLRPGAAEEGMWNALAAHCYDGDEVCPTHQMAIELGGQIFSVATVLTPSFSGSVQISANLDGYQLKALLQIMNHGPASVGLVNQHSLRWASTTYP
jgi:hypothetical protein